MVLNMLKTLTLEELAQAFDRKTGFKDGRRILIDARIAVTLGDGQPGDIRYTETDSGHALNWLLSSFPTEGSARYRLESAGGYVQQFGLRDSRASLRKIDGVSVVSFGIAGPKELHIINPTNMVYIPETFQR